MHQSPRTGVEDIHEIKETVCVQFSGLVMFMFLLLVFMRNKSMIG